MSHLATPSPAAVETAVVREVTAITAATVLAASLVAVVLPDSAGARGLVAALLLGGLTVLAVRRPREAVIVTLAWLVVLGLSRRLLSMVQADPANDPLLLVGPVASGVLAVQAVRQGAARRPSVLAMAVGAYLVITALAVLNPSLPIRDNAEGWLYYGVPLLWFVIGRGLLDDDADAKPIVTLTLTLGTAAVLTSLAQALIGFPPWDHRWIQHRGYATMGVSGIDTLRPFGWSSSSQESALLCGVVAVAGGVLARWAWQQRRPWVAAVAAGIAGAGVAGMLLSGFRTSVVLGGLGLLVVFAAARGWRFWWLLLATVVALGALSVSVRVLGVERWYDHGIVGLLRRSLVGLSHPFTSQDSTLSHHVALTRYALRHLDDHPLGFGPASGTNAHRAVGYARPFSAENDLGNAALAFGIPGLGVFLVMLVTGLRLAWRSAHVRRNVGTLVALGVAVVSLRFWTNGNHYGTAALLWVLLGWLDNPDRPDADAEAHDPSPAPSPSS